MKIEPILFCSFENSLEKVTKSNALLRSKKQQKQVCLD